MTRSTHARTGVALIVAMLTPIVAIAQVTSPGTQRPGGRIGGAARANCVGADSASFQRAVGAAPAGAAGQTRQITGGTERSHMYPEYDVVLDIPNLCVERIHLRVDSLTARLSVNAQVANLLRVNAGADVLIGNVDLTIRGVRAKALLLVDLDDVVMAIDNTLTFVDNHPEVVSQLTGTVQNVGSAVGGVVGDVVGGVRGLLLGTSRNSAGQTIQRVVDAATGQILERTLAAAGNTLSQRVTGAIGSLPQVSETRDAAGMLVRRVRDTSGSIIEYVQDAAGKLSNIRIVSSGTTQPPD
jgi:hypothetical protein